MVFDLRNFLFITPLKTNLRPKNIGILNPYLYTNMMIMNNRSQKLVQIRPLIPSAKILPNMSSEEHFQNETLRPILKLQNDLLLASFQNYIVKMKSAFYELKLENRMDYISNAIQKDIKLRNSLKGMLIGQFTLEEYETYIIHSSALNKRMMNMVIKRIQDQIQFFEKIALV